MRKLEIKAGDRYGRLIIFFEVDPYIKPNGSRFRKFNCICDCGNSLDVVLNDLRNGHTTSCGCYHKDVLLNNKFKLTHKLSKTSEYKAWTNMKLRCYNQNNNNYINYGARGIIVCQRWLDSFENFIEDMGMKSSVDLSIDRINNDGNYEPTNCKWSDCIEQNNNRRNVKKGSV